MGQLAQLDRASVPLDFVFPAIAYLTAQDKLSREKAPQVRDATERCPDPTGQVGPCPEGTQAGHQLRGGGETCKKQGGGSCLSNSIFMENERPSPTMKCPKCGKPLLSSD